MRKQKKTIAKSLEPHKTNHWTTMGQPRKKHKKTSRKNHWTPMEKHKNTIGKPLNKT